MPHLGGPEVLIVALIFVLLFGAKKLPDLGSSLGKGIKNFKSGVKEGRKDDTGSEAADDAADVSLVPSGAIEEARTGSAGSSRLGKADPHR